MNNLKSRFRIKKNYKFNKQKTNEITLRRFIPNFITMSALCIGLTSIKFGLSGQLKYAVLCLLFSSILDATDGRLARFFGSSSHFGAEIDSLADFVNFGVSPAILAYLISLQKYSDLGWGIALFFVICSCLRLARFNTSKFYPQKEEEPWEHNYSVGVPAPAGAILAVSPIIFFFSSQNEIFLSPLFLTCSFCLSGMLMISRIKTFVFKNIKITKKSVPILIACIGICVIFIITKLWETMTFISIIYLFSIPYSNFKYKKTLNCNEPKISEN